LYDIVKERLVETFDPAAETLANICNASFHEGVFCANLMTAVVETRLKKPTLNPDDMN